MADLNNLRQAIIDGDARTAGTVAREAIASGHDALALIQAYMVPAMDEVGRRYECEEFFVPELLLSARAMKAALEPIRPMLAASGAKPAGKVVIGTVKGDLHDIGKNLVGVMWKGANFKVVDLGTNVPPAKFVAAIVEHKPQLVGLSALLTTTMPAMVETVRAIRASGCPPIKIMVGGAPVSQQFADEIGADGYAADAGSAVDRARALVGAA